MGFSSQVQMILGAFIKGLMTPRNSSADDTPPNRGPRI